MGRKATGLPSLRFEYGSRVTEYPITHLDADVITLFTATTPTELLLPRPYLNYFNKL
jgi:hypothetical protein